MRGVGGAQTAHAPRGSPNCGTCVRVAPPKCVTPGGPGLQWLPLARGVVPRGTRSGLWPAQRPLGVGSSAQGPAGDLEHTATQGLLPLR